MATKSASVHVKNAAQQLPPAVTQAITNKDSTALGNYWRGQHNQGGAIRSIALAGGGNLLRDDVRTQHDNAWTKAIMTPALALGGGALGAYSLYQALRPVAPKVKNADKARQAEQAVESINVPEERIEKTALHVRELAGDVANAIGVAVHGVTSGASQALTNTNNSPFDGPRASTALMAGIPALGYLGYQVAKMQKPKKNEAQNLELQNEISQFDQALRSEYAAKNAALAACDTLLNSFEEAFEKDAGFWNMYPAAAALGVGASGLLTYKMMNRLDPNRIAYEAAKDAYRRQQMVTKPKVRVTTLDPGEDPEEVAGLSNTNNLIVPLPSISDHQTKMSAAQEAQFKDWYLSLDETEKVASLVNMVKQAWQDLTPEQAMQLSHDPEVMQRLQQEVGQQGGMDGFIFSHMSPERAQRTLEQKMQEDPTLLTQLNQRLAADPEQAQFIENKLHHPTFTGHLPGGDHSPAGTAVAGPNAPKEPTTMQRAGQGAADVAGSAAQNPIVQMIMQHPMQAAGMAASLLAMGGGHQALGLIGLLLSVFGPQIWHAIGEHFGGGPEGVQKAQQAAHQAQTGQQPAAQQSPGSSTQPSATQPATTPPATQPEASGQPTVQGSQDKPLMPNEMGNTPGAVGPLGKAPTPTPPNGPGLAQNTAPKPPAPMGNTMPKPPAMAMNTPKPGLPSATPNIKAPFSPSANPLSHAA